MAPRSSIGFYAREESHRHFAAINPTGPLPDSIHLRVDGLVACTWLHRSIALYTAFIFTEVAIFIVAAVMLDSMMADVVEDSEKQTNRRSEGLFFAARSFAGKFVSASGIISAGLIITAVGFDAITSVADFTGEHRIKLAQLFLPAYCSLILGAIACISLYQIDRSTHEQNIKILNDRSMAENSDGIELEKP